MLRLILPIGVVLTLANSSEAQPAAGTPQASEDAAVKQEGLARKFRDFEQALLRLTQRMEQSDNTTDRKKAAVLRKAVQTASKEGTDLKFDKLVRLVRESHAIDGTLNELEELLRQNKMVAADIRALLRLLMDGDRLARLKEDEEWFGGILRELDRLIAAEKKIRADLDLGKPGLDKQQPPVTKDTERLADEIDKRLDNDADAPGKRVRSAAKRQAGAQRSLEGDAPGDAGPDLDGAIKDLEDARRDFRDRRNHAHHDRRNLLLEKLLALLGSMHSGQTEVRDATVNLDTELADEKPTRAQQQQALRLADRQAGVRLQAKEVLELLQKEGSAVAFGEAAKLVYDDVAVVENRLNRGDVGKLTQKVETDVIETIEVMMDALRKSLQVAGPPTGGPGGDGPTVEKPLVDFVTELKTIRFMQAIVNDRTAAYAKQFEGEQANDANLRQELRGLAVRQQVIVRMAQELPKKK